MMTIRKHYPGIYSESFTPAEMAEIYREHGLDEEPQKRSPSAQDFRPWAVRLNDRIERWLDRVDWVAIELRLEKLGGVLLTGVAVYFLFVVLNAWLQGHFNLGGAR